MKFFLDTAKLNEIREGAALGLVDGVTTNSSLVAKEGGVDFKQHVAAICELVKGDVSTEVPSLDTEGMLREGRAYMAAMPFKVMPQLIKHQSTDKRLDQFLADWRKIA